MEKLCLGFRQIFHYLRKKGGFSPAETNAQAPEAPPKPGFCPILSPKLTFSIPSVQRSLGNTESTGRVSIRLPSVLQQLPPLWMISSGREKENLGGLSPCPSREHARGAANKDLLIFPCGKTS